jgi:hypothetical protein
MIAAAALMPDSGPCHVISYAIDPLLGVEMLPSGGAIARAHVLLSKRKGHNVSGRRYAELV